MTHKHYLEYFVKNINRIFTSYCKHTIYKIIRPFKFFSGNVFLELLSLWEFWEAIKDGQTNARNDVKRRESINSMFSSKMCRVCVFTLSYIGVIQFIEKCNQAMEL